ncbi:DegT/DnrJ/EryC1/StrS family aminotransferase [Vreelandella utahensis]|uniref:DegT/DnrJ/EryC1/StrS family aminotransferase n=1 Tax=Vreelandella halophila TaxID=86177 RepID=UPI000986396C|nr:DegT/DnrJ/EryC1/StrS family aminotransferase [Halomonas utahensis]
MIPATRPSIPNRKTLERYLDGVFERAWLTNDGPLVRELTERLEDYLGVENLLLVANGTLALQVAYKALNIEREAVTTPFTFIATASAMQWQGIEPNFADVDPGSMNLSPERAEQAITETTDGIVPVHVYGHACDVEAFDNLSARNNLSLVYDASHCFGVNYQGQSLLNWGDAATLSFHATKLYHTVEGGGIVFRDRNVLEKAKRMINFGQSSETSDIEVGGINAKMSEVHAAVGLANLDSIDEVIEKRLALVGEYRQCLGGAVIIPEGKGSNNGAYLPVLCASSGQAEVVDRHLRDSGVSARRYFRPALNRAAVFRSTATCPVAEDVSARVICVPLSSAMTVDQVRWISRLIKEVMS